MTKNMKNVLYELLFKQKTQTTRTMRTPRTLLKITVIWMMIILSGANLTAQVTIGSDINPVKGALLDLKDQAADANNVTATKGGLVLPRVNLVSRTSLEPFVSGMDPQLRSDHVGLTVYNLTNDGSFYPGIYIWMGNEWRAIETSTNYVYLPAFRLKWEASPTPIKLFEDVFQQNFAPANADHYYTSILANNYVIEFPSYNSNKTDYYYVVTDYDTTYFNIIEIDADGALSYSKKTADATLPAEANPYVNVVMIHK
jgi:hypothetical protein